jgi:hypothetical protein
MIFEGHPTPNDRTREYRIRDGQSAGQSKQRGFCNEQGVIVAAGIKDQRPSAGESRFKSFMIC